MVINVGFAVGKPNIDAVFLLAIANNYSLLF
ncbi:hypothetical protein GB2207_05699 [marine gamma proteobacterium HTCC2207]|uniref:Uncharacterized protein n=1 Tax=gamma proteobacterium HTCC2207 TaxID=314287 RepID=Q1YPX9_9GAMM|nr:hypothetical protein GB2207_05699 [marine gamma proteobacterium HTCC2207] [gamma proteobacterium HTCC2207]